MHGEFGEEMISFWDLGERDTILNLVMELDVVKVLRMLNASLKTSMSLEFI
jgi:hypothetical protein